MTEPALDELRLRRLIDAGRSLIAKLDVDAVLHQLLDVAREVTGARYAAVGVLDDSRQELERFVTAGIDPETHRAIGDLPRGRGILGLLIEDPRPLRLEHIGDHPQSYGFPAAHPEMETFLGRPGDDPRGGLGQPLSDGEGGRDTVHATPTRNRPSSSPAGRRSRSTTRASTVPSRSGATTSSARSAGSTPRSRSRRRSGGETDLNRILELIVKRARALVGARTLVIMLEQEADLVVTAGAGELRENIHGQRLDIESTVSGRVLRSGRAERIDDARDVLTRSFELLHFEAENALLVPLDVPRARRGRPRRL